MAALAITFVLLLLLGAPIFYAVAISASAFVVFTGSNTLSIISQKMVDGTVSTTTSGSASFHLFRKPHVRGMHEATYEFRRYAFRQDTGRPRDRSLWRRRFLRGSIR